MKTVLPCPNPVMPELLEKQWPKGSTLHEYWDRDRNWFLVDGELYYEDPDTYEGKEVLLQHWTQLLYRRNRSIDQWPMVRKNGEYLFEIHYTDHYETSVRAPSDGKFFVVHAG